ncbi:MAG: hypothetical protein J6T44_05300 [Prevotella sp.]|jgi:hypothetical protein|nr:hypothetical protein [Prevotella sp.]MBO7538679.1 hypothetical protein [Prevotella sp.]
MIEFNLKRIKGNRSVTHGRLSIPRFNFACHTLELADGNDLMFKQNCCINTGTYQLVAGFDQKEPLYPVFRYKPVGFAKKPSFNLEVNDYLHLVTGDIALGVAVDSEWAVRQTIEFADKFRELCREIALQREIMVLTVYKSRHYEFEDRCYEDEIHVIDEMNFFEGGSDDEE